MKFRLLIIVAIVFFEQALLLYPICILTVSILSRVWKFQLRN